MHLYIRQPSWSCFSKLKNLYFSLETRLRNCEKHLCNLKAVDQAAKASDLGFEFPGPQSLIIGILNRINQKWLLRYYLHSLSFYHSDKTHTCTNTHTQTKTTRIPYCLLFFMTSQMGYRPVDGLTDGDAKTHLKISAVMSVLMSSFRIFWRNCLKGTWFRHHQWKNEAWMKCYRIKTILTSPVHLNAFQIKEMFSWIWNKALSQFYSRGLFVGLRMIDLLEKELLDVKTRPRVDQ